MLKYKKVTVLKMFIFIFILFPVFFSQSYAKSDYNLNFRKDIEITWKYSKVDKDLIEKIKNIFNSSLSCLDSNHKEDSRIMHYIKDIEETSDNWKVKVYYKHNDGSYRKSKELKIYKDPNKIPDDWFYEINDLKLRYIPYHVNDYLDELVESAPLISNTSILKGSSSQLLIYRFNGNNTIISELNYDNAGIIDEFKLKIDDETAYYYEKISIKTNDYNPYSLIIAIIIIILMCIIQIPLAYILLSHKKKYTSEDLTFINQNQMNSNEPRVKSLEYIENKNSNREPVLVPVTEKLNIVVSEENSEAFYEKYEFFEKDNLTNDNLNESKKYESKFDLIIKSNCPFCGSKRDMDGRYCYYCGNKYEN